MWPDPSPAAHLTWVPTCSLIPQCKDGPARTEKEAKPWLHYSLLLKTQAYVTKWDQQSWVLPFKGSFINTKLCCFLAVLTMGKTTCSSGGNELCLGFQLSHIAHNLSLYTVQLFQFSVTFYNLVFLSSQPLNLSPQLGYKHGAGDVTQWQSASLDSLKPWIQCPVLPKKIKFTT